MKKILKFTAIFITVLAILLSGFLGVAIAYARKNIDFALDRELFEKAKQDQTVYYYARGTHGELVEVYKSTRETVREWVSFDEVSSNLKLAFLAMEDREFYEHKGVNFKRTVAALINHIFKQRPSFGASTITQQVIKNISGDNEASVTRKLKEIFRAMSLESKYSKDDIFELYMNIVPMTGNIYGVSAAAEIYFGKKASALSLEEAATIVGITNAPAKYNPYTKPQECTDKRNRVLYAMQSVGYITSDEYARAIDAPLQLSNGTGNYGVSSWFIETANEEIMKDICDCYSLSKGAARLMMNGARVILTMNPDVQKILDEYFADTDNLSAKFKEGLNYSMVISDPFSGDLLGIIGNGGKKQGNRLFNYATANITPGSVIKPLSLYAPLIEDGAITWSTMIEDAPTEYIPSSDGEIPYPKNTPDIYEGFIDINDALKKSKNTVAIRLYNMLGANRIFDHLYYGFGFDTLVREGSISDMSSAPLALGQLSYGVSLRRLTEAYNVFPSEGIFSRGRSYIGVYDQNGECVIDKNVRRERIYSRDTAQVMNQLLSDVVSDGTARQIRLKELVDVAGKTGTSGNDRDRLFVGFTPYFTAGIWCGFGNLDRSVGHNTPGHLQIWDEVMGRIHEKLVFRAYTEELDVFRTDKIVAAPYCSKSGLGVTYECELDDTSSIKLGYFKVGNLPKEECDYHKRYLQEDEDVV